jgi:excisionase family DNA binding protein
MPGQLLILTEREQIAQFFKDTQQTAQTVAESKTKPVLPTKPLTIDDLCTYFGVTRQTITAWMKQGILPYYKIARRVYFKADEIWSKIPGYDMSDLSKLHNTLRGGKYV